MKLRGFVLLGATIDFLATLDMVFVRDHNILGTGITSFLITYIALVVVKNIASSPESLKEIIAYGIGGAIGAMITVALL